MNPDRRSFVWRVASGSVLSLSFTVAGTTLLLTPAQAHARAIPLRQLAREQALALERLGETILPGSAQHGLTHFIDHQLAVSPNDSLLIAKYFRVPPPYLHFYAGGVSAAGQLAQNIFSRPLVDLDEQQMTALVGEMSAPGRKVVDFDLLLFYLCLRSAAVDVVYGTPQGFRRLNVPYMEHILPPEGWDG